MDITRLAVDAGAFINRAVQEALGQAEKTELDSRLESLLDRAESTKTWTDKIISQTETLLDLLYKGLDWSAPERPHTADILLTSLCISGITVASTPGALPHWLSCDLNVSLSYVSDWMTVAIHWTFSDLTKGLYVVGSGESILIALSSLILSLCFLSLCLSVSLSLSLSLNANPLGEEYVAHVSYMFSFLRVRWLKMWAQKVSRAEMELRISQCVFDRQSEITRLLLEGINTTHAAHLRSLSDFVEAQGSYYAQCYQLTQDLHTQLAWCVSVCVCVLTAFYFLSL
ncbi:unnamed protein product [Oncorhynchus mykiss]|uniref:BAR domain-containing protein n=1 Tax=Oncorhynchus mykiss TaxID=8022 RepID=A0A060YRT4_ONCMY|nr:unnamed protein product [Oncorhynchus mykiss]